ncbi:MAG: hypothetical protein ACPGJV_08665 [Bacteriovoracaceae bacterium]
MMIFIFSLSINSFANEEDFKDIKFQNENLDMPEHQIYLNNIQFQDEGVISKLPQYSKTKSKTPHAWGLNSIWSFSNIESKNASGRQTTVFSDISPGLKLSYNYYFSKDTRVGITGYSQRLIFQDPDSNELNNKFSNIFGVSTNIKLKLFRFTGLKLELGTESLPYVKTLADGVAEIDSDQLLYIELGSSLEMPIIMGKNNISIKVGLGYRQYHVQNNPSVNIESAYTKKVFAGINIDSSTDRYSLEAEAQSGDVNVFGFKQSFESVTVKLGVSFGGL